MRFAERSSGKRMKRRNLSLELSSSFCIFSAFLILLIPIEWLLAAAAAATIHELCHYGMIRLCGGEVSELHIGGGGAVMEAGLLTRGRECLCALAGPAGGLLLLLGARWIPRIAICAAVQSVYNLLPIFPLDGGRAIRCMLEMLFPEGKVKIICRVVELVCFLLILALCLILSRRRIWYPIIIPLLLLIHIGKIKIPCKPGR